MSVEQDLDMKGAVFLRLVQMPMISVAGSVRLGGAKLGGLILYGATVGKDLAFADFEGPIVEWLEFEENDGDTQKPILNLWNVSVGALVDSRGAWPPKLRLLLRDFTYERFLPLDGIWQGTFDRRDADSYISWLAQDRPYSFQPYWQLATVLKSHGETAKANDILIAGRERERLQQSRRSEERLGLSIFGRVIGYGYGARELQALWFLLPLILVGWVTARFRGEPYPDGKRLGFWYSCDMILPGIWLSQRHPSVALRGGARYYFQFHRLMGYVLLFVAASGLAGLME